MPDTSALHSASAALAAGRQVQSGRIRAISENLANADSVPTTPGGAPYARKIAVFAPVAADSPRDPVGRIARDTTGFRTRYDPTSPGADPSGYVRLPNVNSAGRIGRPAAGGPELRAEPERLGLDQDARAGHHQPDQLSRPCRRP